MAVTYSTPQLLSQPSERVVYEALRGLPDDWHVLHSVSWLATGRSRRFDGEADFVLLNQRVGMIVVEVKGGDLDIDRGQWLSVNRKGDRRPVADPFQQVKDNAYELHRQLRRVTDGNIPFGYAVVLPTAAPIVRSRAGSLGAAIWTRMELASPTQAVDDLCRLFRLDTRDGLPDFSAVLDFLAPTITVARAGREAALLADAELEALTRIHVTLTEGQISLLSRLRGERRAVIYGRAGTGKTLMALARAQRLVNEGHRVLLTCSRMSLALSLRYHAAAGSIQAESGFGPDAFAYRVPSGLAPAPLVIESFRNLVAACAAEAGAPSASLFDHPLTAADEQPLWKGFNDAERYLRLEYQPFDAIVVDEGQQFPPLWFAVLGRLFVAADGPTYVFTDPLQAFVKARVDGAVWCPPFDDPSFYLTVNCRNTLPISRLLDQVTASDTIELGVDGPAPELINAWGIKDHEAKVIDVLTRLLDEGLSPDEIAVITLPLSESANHLRRTTAKRLVKLLSEPGILPNGVAARGLAATLVQKADYVRVATSREFQGFESTAVVVVTGELELRGDELRVGRELYIAMSRARSRLVVIGDPEVIRMLRGLDE